MPHEPTIVVWTGMSKVNPYSTYAMTSGKEQGSETFSVARGVHRAGPDKIKHFVVDVEELGMSERGEDYDVCGKVTVEGKSPAEFNYGNIKAVLMMDTADYLSERMKVAVIEELAILVQKVKDLPTEPHKQLVAH